MDSKQIWYGCYFRLNDISKFLSSINETEYKRTTVHELFITWIVAKFLTFQKKSEHVIGFPFLKNNNGLVLADFFNNDIALDNDNFDTVIADVKNLEIPIRLQIKQYTRVHNASTEDFFNFMCSKVERYGKALKINFVFHISQNMKFNFPKFEELIKGIKFKVGSIIVFFTKPISLLQVFPNYTGKLWSPKTEDNQNQ